MGARILKLMTVVILVSLFSFRVNPGPTGFRNNISGRSKNVAFPLEDESKRVELDMVDFPTQQEYYDEHDASPMEFQPGVGAYSKSYDFDFEGTRQRCTRETCGNMCGDYCNNDDCCCSPPDNIGDVISCGSTVGLSDQGCTREKCRTEYCNNVCDGDSMCYCNVSGN